MKIDKLSSVSDILLQKDSKKDGIDVAFDEILSANLQAIQLENKIQQKLDDFKEKLTSVGAYSYLSELSSQRIDQKLEQKRLELEKAFGLDDMSKSADERAELTKVVSGFLNEYKAVLEQGSKNNLISQKQQNLDKQGSFVNLADLLAKLT